MSAKKKRRHLFLLLHFCLPFCTIFRNAARMSETFLIIDMMLGSQGLSSTYEQAHVDLDLLTLAS